MQQILKNIEAQNKLIASRAKNEPIKDIAKSVGVSERTIYRFSNKPEIAEKITALAEKYVSETLDDIAEQDIHEFKTAKTLSKDIIDALQEKSHIVEVKDGKVVELFPAQKISAIHKHLERVDKKVSDFKRGIGMLPAHMLSPIYQQYNIYQDNRTIISPQVMDLISGKIDDIVEAEVEEVE